MNIKKILFCCIFLTFSSVFAEENVNNDIYEDDGIPAKPSVSENYNSSSKNKEKNLDKKSEVEKFPKFEGRLLSEFMINVLDNSKDKVQKSDGIVNSYLYLETLMRLRITKGFFIETQWYLEPTNERLYSGDIYAGNPNYIVGNAITSDFYGKDNHVKRKFQVWTYGLGVETLNIGYKNTNAAFAIGKINPNFGTAFDKARFNGIYGTSLAEEYALKEKIGGYISALLPFGNITFSAFFDDTTHLSNTMFEQRGRDKSIGGAGNTEKLNNFSLTFDGKFDNLSLNAGFRFLETELKEEENEKGFVLGAEYLMELNYDINFLPFFEIAFFNNYDGMTSRDIFYFTGFLPLFFENWHIVFTTTIKFDDEKYYHNYTSYINQISIGYKFDFGLMLDIAKVWERYAKKANGFTELEPKDKWVKRADAWVFMVSYLFKF